MLRAIDSESFLSDPVVGLVGNLDYRRGDGTLFVGELVIELIAFLHDGLEILVDRVDGARGVHPAAVLIETLVDKKLAPGNRAVGVQAFVAGHLQFRPEVEGRMRID